LYGGATNEEIAEIQVRFPDSFYGFGTVDLSGAPEAAAVAAEINHAIRDLGLYGISLDPGFCEPPLRADDRLVVEAARACGRLGVPLMLTMAGLAGPDIYWCHPQFVDRLAIACPDTNLVLAHGCWPHVQSVCAVAIARSNVYVSPDQGMMNTVGTSDYVAAINTFMADQFVFASSFPTGPLVEMIGIYENLPIRDKVRPKIMYENGARLLGLL
jgi:predicted TIM-barrel fold metal-dependent hydrolase